MSSKRSLFVRLLPCRCLRGEEEPVTSLDYSHCSLEQVPKEIFSFEKTLEELYLDANQIEELPKQLFNCQLLYRLSLPDNDLTVLPPGIANLINLRELDVSKNSIQEFPENIKNCKVLAIIEASVNPISKLPEGFTQLLSLTQLYLNDAFLEFLPASFGRLTKLQILELRENQLKMLPKSMHKLTQLERLDLGSNEFTEVPEVLEQLRGIRELWMDGNKLTFLPGMIGALKQLCYLDVSKNNLEMVDEQISGCENLQDLLLSNNALTQLPGSIGSLKRLTTLKVDDNQLMYLPDTIGGLTTLDELDCSFNEIEALPSTIGQCVNLRTFAADHNLLTQMPPEMGSLKNVTVLFLHSNKLETLPEEMGDMQKLKVINLSDNKLKNLPYSFTKLNQMTAVWLSENQSKPLIPLQKEEDPETHKTVLTNYMFPQQTRTEDYLPNSDSESFNPSLWEEQRKQRRAQVAFECDEDKDERETPPREGNLKRYPTPYPDELKNMVKTAQSVAHRLKEDESGDEAGKETRAKELSSEEEEMKIAEMRPPLIEISINQPKVVALSKDKKGKVILALLSHFSLENGNRIQKTQSGENFNGRTDQVPLRYESTRTVSTGVTALSDMSLSRSTEELSPEKKCPPAPVVKSQSIANMDAEGMKLYSIEGESPPYEVACAARTSISGAQGQSIVRSKSASLLNDQPLQIYPGSSASSSDLLSSSKPPISSARYPTGPPPQYNIQYASSTVPKDSLWSQRTPVPPEQPYLPPQHSLANTNYSNRNNAPPYPQPQQRGPPKTPDMWAKERMLPSVGQRGALQRQGSGSSGSPMCMPDPRRMPGMEGEYMTYRDIHAAGRGPLQMSQALHRPLSARTYSMDGPNAPQPQSARPPPHELPERTMSVSDFNYQHASPSKRPSMRVKSEHSLLDGPVSGGGRVPADWRDQVMRHIEAKKMEKVWSFLQIVYAKTSIVPLMNGQMCPPVRSPMSCGQPPMARHPSREQLIDYLMLKVSQQPPGPPRVPHETLQQEVHTFLTEISCDTCVCLQLHVKIEKNPELGFSISGGVGGHGNPFRPDDNGIFVTRVQSEGPASKLLQPGDKIIQVISTHPSLPLLSYYSHCRHNILFSYENILTFD
uniref:Protein LAP2-like n=1 Tax=Sinocyclocheilus anshuiensis TaxID=1608454 RepID=A0A671L0S6_9TELE